MIQAQKCNAWNWNSFAFFTFEFSLDCDYEGTNEHLFRRVFVIDTFYNNCVSVENGIKH